MACFLVAFVVNCLAEKRGLVTSDIKSEFLLHLFLHLLFYTYYLIVVQV